MNILAKQLNEAILGDSAPVHEMLSRLGKNIYYIKEGILSQSTEAKARAKRFNATLGTAVKDGQPMHLSVIQDTLGGYAPKDIYEYAPTAGKPELRALWQQKLLAEHPGLEERLVGMPIATTGLTHGLSIVADLFADEGDALIIPDKIWENYEITFGVRRGSVSETYPLFGADNRHNTAGLRQAILKQKEKGKAIAVLNFPNNPTGYTPDEQEAGEIIDALITGAEAGINLVVLVDDAYFGLFYGDSIRESLFARLAGLHPRILPVRVDGATKEDYATGLRVGFLTFASPHRTVLDALEQKALGLIRATISSGPHPSQTFVLQALKSPQYPAQKRANHEIIAARAKKVMDNAKNRKFSGAWEAYPFNSGYFMCLKLLTVNAEELRRHLLDRYETGTIALNDTDLRLAVPCINEEDWEELFATIYRGIQELEELTARGRE